MFFVKDCFIARLNHRWTYSKSFLKEYENILKECFQKYRIKLGPSSPIPGIPALKNRECRASWERCTFPEDTVLEQGSLLGNEAVYIESVDPLLIRNQWQDSVSPPIYKTYQNLRVQTTLLMVQPQGRILRAIVFRAPLKIVGSNTVEV